MQIGIVAWEPGEFETECIRRAAEEQGYSVLQFELRHVHARIASTGTRVFAGDADVGALGFVISRAQFAPALFGDCIDKYKLLESSGVLVSETLESYLNTESKVLTYCLLSKSGIPYPRTAICRNAEDLRAFAHGQETVVVKPSYGYGGHDVERFSSGQLMHCANNLEALLEKHGSLIAQEYIPHPEGDYRVTVLGDEIVFCVRRIPNEKTWKANVCLGASSRRESAPREIEQLAIRASHACGLRFAGVDILSFSGKHYVLEVNNTPGWTDFSEPEALGVARRLLGNVSIEFMRRHAAADRSYTQPPTLIGASTPC